MDNLGEIHITDFISRGATGIGVWFEDHDNIFINNMKINDCAEAAFTFKACEHMFIDGIDIKDCAGHADAAGWITLIGWPSRGCDDFHLKNITVSGTLGEEYVLYTTDNTDVEINGVTLECGATQIVPVFINATTRMTFANGLIHCQGSGCIGIKLGGASSAVRISKTLIEDVQAVPTLGTGIGAVGGAIGVVERGSVRVIGATTRFGSTITFDAVDGTATITAGNTYVDVTHELTPHRQCRHSAHSERRSSRAELQATTSVYTTFRIKISTLDTVNHSFSWSAVI